jgi:hypothetical protein
MKSVVGIAKAGEMRTSTAVNAKVQYTFQRYDDMAAAIGKAFREHQVATAVAESSTEYHTWEKPTQNGVTLWTQCRALVRFQFTSLVDGSTFPVVAAGEGTDSSDKATNKAMTSAYKNALKIAFTLSTGEDDPDEHRPEIVTRNQVPDPAQQGYRDPGEDTVWQSVEQLATQPTEQNPESSRVEIAVRAVEGISRARTSGDLAALAAWALGKGAMLVDLSGGGVTVARRILAARATVPAGPRSNTAQQTQRPGRLPSQPPQGQQVRDVPLPEEPEGYGS